MCLTMIATYSVGWHYLVIGTTDQLTDLRNEWVKFIGQLMASCHDNRYENPK